MKLEHATCINAPRSVVWSVTLDIERWPQWTPTVTSIERLDEGVFRRGSRALIKQPGLPAAEWVVTDLTPEERFTWESYVRGIHMIATHELTTQVAGTQSVLRLEMSGVVARLLWPLIRFSVRKSLQRENAGLKARCEAMASVG